MAGRGGFEQPIFRKSLILKSYSSKSPSRTALASFVLCAAIDKPPPFNEWRRLLENLTKPQFTFKVADSEDCDVTCCGVPVAWVGLPPQPANKTRSIHPDMTSRNRRPAFLRLPLAQIKAIGTPRKPIPAAKRTCSRLDADAVVCWLTVNTTMI